MMTDLSVARRRRCIAIVRDRRLAGWALFVAPLVSAPAMAMDEPHFVSAVVSDAAANELFAADLDGDGDADVLSVDSFGDVIRWHERLDGDAFAAPKVVSTATDGPVRVCAADLDGDGDLDVLAASSSDGAFSWFENLGPGVFGAKRSLAAAPGASSVAAADFDADGDLDVLTGAAGDGTVGWQENLGAGVFSPRAILTGGATGVAYVCGVDLDVDGDADVLFASSAHVAWVENLGSAVFGPPVVVPGSPDIGSSVSVADLDGDGDPEIVGSRAVPTREWPFLEYALVWLENLGGASFAAAKTIDVLGLPGAVGCADIDGDGDREVFTAGRRWYRNLGGGFGPPQIVASWGLGGATGTSVVAGDVGTDASFGILIGELNGITGYRVAFAERFSGPRVVSVATGASYGPVSVEAADLDGDARPDILEATGLSSEIAWYRNLGGGQFGGQQVISSQVKVAIDAHAADLDGDGDLDVLSASQSDDKVAWYANLGLGVFGAQQVLTTSADQAAAVTAADLDGDGDLDVMTASEGDDTVAWYANLGGGAFQGPSVLSNTSDRAHDVAAADFDRDGDLDVVAVSVADDTVAWYANLGGGVFGAAIVVSTFADGAFKVRTPDLNGDGDPDILVACALGGSVVWFENLGGGAFSTQKLLSPSVAYSVTAADFDRDGDSDVAWSAPLAVSWHDNLVAGVFGDLQVVDNTRHGGVETDAADLDGDGDVDLLVAEGGPAGAIVWYENRGGVYGDGCPGSGGFVPELERIGSATPGASTVLEIGRGLGGSVSALFFGASPASVPTGTGCTLLLIPVPSAVVLPLSPGGPGDGAATLPATTPPGTSPLVVYLQAFVLDPGANGGYAATAGLKVSVQ